MKKYLKSNIFSVILVVIIIYSFTVKVYASPSNGTINPTQHQAQVCEDTSCSVTSTSPVNFGYFTSTPASNVSVSNTELRGFIWGKSFGWVVLNCNNTTSGCTSLNASFKIANTINGQLSGYAWGENSGWINFGPFSNSSTASVVINSAGEFNGYAWSQNFGWIKFDCTDMNYCVQTDWRTNNSVTSSSSSGGYAQCADRKDNDNDGFIDFPNDPGCESLSDTSENTLVINPTNQTDPIMEPITSELPIKQSFCKSNPTSITCNPPSFPNYCTLHPKDFKCIPSYIPSHESALPAQSSTQNSIVSPHEEGGIRGWLQKLRFLFIEPTHRITSDSTLKNVPFNNHSTVRDGMLIEKNILIHYSLVLLLIIIILLFLIRRKRE